MVYFVREFVIYLLLFIIVFCREINGFVGDYFLFSEVVNNDESCEYSFVGLNFFNFGLGFVLKKGLLWL